MKNTENMKAIQVFPLVLIFSALIYVAVVQSQSVEDDMSGTFYLLSIGRQLYDDFSSGQLDPSKWTEGQDPEGWPLMGQHYVDSQEQRYHTQSVGNNDQRVVLHLTGYQFGIGDVLEYDVYYNTQSGSNGVFVYLNGGPTYRLVTCPHSVLPVDPLGIYHFTISFKSTHIEVEKKYQNNVISVCNLPLNQQWSYGGRTWSSAPPWTIGIESYKGGSPSSSFIHADIDDVYITTGSSSNECGSIPTDGCVVSQSTTFTPGFYDLPNGILINESSITLDCNGATLDGSNGLVNGDGITIIGKNNIVIKNCNIQYYKEYGIRANEMHDSILRENNITHSRTWHGIYAVNSSNNIVEDNFLTENRHDGITFGEASENNTIRRNTITNNPLRHGIYLYAGANKNQLIGNKITNMSNSGVAIEHSTENKIISNFIRDNQNYGIVLSWADNNIVYNNYFNNRINAQNSGINQWNTTKTPGRNIVGGPYIAGNFWSDYQGVDYNLDGIGDTNIPYNVSNQISNGGDYLPLVPLIIRRPVFEYDEFSEGILDPAKWSEVPGSNINNLFTDEHFVDINERAYHTAQIIPADKGVKLNLLQYTFAPGESVSFDANYQSGSGNNIHFIDANDNNVRGIALFGTWNGINFCAGNAFGLYHVKTFFTEQGVDVEVTKPDNTVVLCSQFGEIQGANQYQFSVVTRTGHDGTMHIDYDNFVING